MLAEQAHGLGRHHAVTARYSPSDLADALGPGFTIGRTRSEQHTTPDGTIQPFTCITATSAGPR